MDGKYNFNNYPEFVKFQRLTNCIQFYDDATAKRFTSCAQRLMRNFSLYVYNIKDDNERVLAMSYANAIMILIYDLDKYIEEDKIDLFRQNFRKCFKFK